MGNDLTVLGVLKRFGRIAFGGGKTGGAAACTDLTPTNQKLDKLQGTVTQLQGEVTELKGTCAPKAPASQPVDPSSIPVLFCHTGVNPNSAEKGTKEKPTVVNMTVTGISIKIDPSDNIELDFVDGSTASAKGFTPSKGITASDVKLSPDKKSITAVLTITHEAEERSSDLRIKVNGRYIDMRLENAFEVKRNKAGAKSSAGGGAKKAKKADETKAPEPVAAPTPAPKPKTDDRCKPGPALKALQNAGICPK